MQIANHSVQVKDAESTSRVPRPEPTGCPLQLPLIAPRLLAWYDRSGRDLPWRRTADSYHIWLSEIMLQQTGVNAALPFYQRFLEHFPTISVLAAAPVERVVEQWAGLGYYSRARNLHRAAQIVVEKHQGAFPDDPRQILALPGIGRSTAGAIGAIAFHRPTPILDGNVRRVLCRLFSLQEPPRSPAAERRLWSWAEALTPEERPGDYAQAIMDLGALLCTPARPDCAVCPLADLCRARQSGKEREIPVRQRKKPVPLVEEVGILLNRKGRFLVRRRPLEGLLGGLWEFPTTRVAAEEGPEAAAARLLAELGFRADPLPAGTVRQTYSHFRLALGLYLGELTEISRTRTTDEETWLSPAELVDLPLHGAHKKALPFLLRRG